MDYEEFCILADQYGLTVAIRAAMATGISRGEAGKWEMQYLKEHAKG